MPWSTSNRRSRLPSNWPTLRAAALDRDHRICHVCQQPDATEVDHVKAGDNHHPSNLAAICTSCHRTKSSAEGHAARPSRKRPPDQHPGLLDPGG